MTVQEAAKRLNLTKPTLYSKVKQGGKDLTDFYHKTPDNIDGLTEESVKELREFIDSLPVKLTGKKSVKSKEDFTLPLYQQIEQQRDMIEALKTTIDEQRKELDAKQKTIDALTVIAAQAQAIATQAQQHKPGLVQRIRLAITGGKKDDGGMNNEID